LHDRLIVIWAGKARKIHSLCNVTKQKIAELIVDIVVMIRGLIRQSTILRLPNFNRPARRRLLKATLRPSHLRQPK
jgi:hypothetical protein